MDAMYEADGSGATGDGAAALYVAEELGLPVFPCGPGKSPHTEHGFKDATTEPAQIEGWWQRWPDALVGVPTGSASGILVVDVDPDGAEWYRQKDIELGAGRVHKTQRGHHLLYRMPEGEVRCSAGKVAPGIDVRGEGGYVIWWPAHGFEAIGELEDLTEPPGWLIDLIHNRDRERTTPADGRIPQGSRNNTLTSIAGKLRAAGLSGEEIYAALAVRNQQCSPPLPDAELRNIAASMERYGASATNQRTRGAPFALIQAGELLMTQRPPDYLIDALIETNTTVGIVGPPESGKSLFAANVAVCVAAGARFHGRRCSQGLVVYLWGEGQQGAARRLQAIERYHDIDLQKAPLVVSKVATSLLEVSELDRVRAAIKSAEERFGLKLRLLIVDTLARFIGGGDESTAHDMGRFLAAVDAIRGEGTAIICHHPGHEDQKRARGSSSWKAALDSEYALAKRGDVVTLTCQKMKDGSKPEPLKFQIAAVSTGAVQPDGTPVQSVVLLATDAVSVLRPLTGKNQRALLSELQRRAVEADAPDGWSEFELRKIGREICGSKSSAKTAVLALIQHEYVVAAHDDRYRLANSQGTESTEHVRKAS
jgi:hypothetical protein